MLRATRPAGPAGVVQAPMRPPLRRRRAGPGGTGGKGALTEAPSVAAIAAQKCPGGLLMPHQSLLHTGRVHVEFGKKAAGLSDRSTRRVNVNEVIS